MGVGVKDCLQGFDPWHKSEDYYLDEGKGGKACEFIEKELKHSKGEFAGLPFKLEDWQRWIVFHLFGWKKKSDNLRRFKKAFIFIPRKNGKTTITAALGLLGLVADNEPGAEVYCAAAEANQAALVFGEASAMVRQNENLNADIRILDGYKSMKFVSMNSYWRVLSSEAGSKHGLNPHMYIIDEVHAQKKAELMEVLETGTGARRQPLGIYLTTADYEGDSPCNRMLKYARKVRDKEIFDPIFLPVVYESDREKDDWTSPAVWARVNPNLNVSVKLEYLKEQCERAKNDPAFENTFKRLHLNMTTEQEKRWMQMEEWDASGAKIEPLELEGKECFVGIDMSSVRDITATVLYFPEYHACKCFFRVPAETAKKRIEYEMWQRQGYLTIEDGKTIDQKAIRSEINELASTYKITAIAYDPWGCSQLAKDLGDTDGFAMVEFRQGYKSMNEPTKALMKLVLDHKLVHFGNPVLRWMCSNAMAMEDPAGNIKLVKPDKDSPMKVDGMIALVMAYGLTLAVQEDAGTIFESGEMDKLLEEVYG
jgi:phage terminase large subunit-like protein